MKRVAYACRDHPDIDFNAGELAALAENEYRVNERGEVKQSKMKISLISNIRFAFGVYARVHYSDYALKVSDNSFNDFKSSVELRDRITHPKKINDLDVSVSEMDRLRSGYQWFLDSFGELMADSTNKMLLSMKPTLTEDHYESIKKALDDIDEKVGTSRP